MLRFSKAVSHAQAPSKCSDQAAGYDLRSAYQYIIPARRNEVIDTGIRIELPEGCYGRIAPRSGLAARYSIDVGAGVIDRDYRGIVKVVLFNHSYIPFQINAGDRIAQLICEKIYYPQLVEVETLSQTERGNNGFGSTGSQ